MVRSYPGGTTFCLQSGVYRLSGPVAPLSGDVISGQPGTVLSGAQVVTGWQQTSTSVWSASGFLPPAYSDTNYNPCQNAATNLCKLDEWLFRDDVELTRVASAAAVVPGTFYTDYAANRIYVGDNPTGHVLEVSRTKTAIESTADHVTAQGLRVEKFATYNQHGAVVANGPYWTVRNCQVRYNHGAGVYTYANNLQVLNSRIDHNGTLGIGVYLATGVLVQGNELDHNNTDGSLINDGENGGYKSTNSSDTVTGNNVHDNLGMGLWFDIDDNGSTITNNTVSNNASSGIRYEISYNATITGNTITGNGHNRQQGDGSLYYGAGLDLSNANGVTVSGNTVTGNDNGIGLVMQNRGSGTYGTWQLANVSVHDNQVDMTTGVTGLVESVNDTSYFTSKNNHYANDHYQLDSLGSLRFSWQNTDGTSSYWTSNGQDTTGTFVAGP